jgi:hypothetical protein
MGERDASEPRIIAAPITGQAVALALAVVSMLLGLAALAPLDLILVGRPGLTAGGCG